MLDKDLFKYGKELVDWVTLWLHGLIAKNKDAGVHRFDDMETPTHLLQTYFKETHCRECGMRGARIDNLCITCPTSNPENLALGNSVRNYRLQVANEIYNTCLRQDVEQGIYDAAIRAAQNTLHPGLHNKYHGTLAIRIPPVVRKTLSSRRWKCFRQLRDIGISAGQDEGGLEPEHFHYTTTVGHVLLLLVHMITQDQGLKGAEVNRLFKFLAPLLRHPDDKRSCFGPFSDHKKAQEFFGPFRLAMLGYLDLVDDPVMTMKHAVDTSCGHLLKAHVEHIQAMARSSPSQERIMEARVRYYSNVVPPESLEAETWICPICLDAANDQEVIQIQCQHQFHLTCIIGVMIQSPANRNLCGLCRTRVDACVLKDQREIYDLPWAQYLALDLGSPLDDGQTTWRSILDAESWPLNRDVVVYIQEQDPSLVDDDACSLF